jgi:hypothetical protein
MINLRKQVTILLAAGTLASVVGSIVFLIFNSRPSADEYLTAPVLYGFYQDAPQRQLFEVTNNIFFDYLQAVTAIAFLGWDAFGNAASFQMIPAVLANYYGPFGATFLAVLVHAVVVLVALAFAIQLLKSNIDRLMFMSIFVLSLFLGVIAAEYQTGQPFGMFPLTGIRFSSYLIQPLMLLLLVFFLVKDVAVGGVNRKKLSLMFIVFPMFVSLWTTMYLLLLVPTVLGVTKLRGKIRSGAISHWAKVYSVLMAIAAFNASFVLLPKVNIGRSIAENVDSSDALTEHALTYLMSEKAGAYFLGVLQTVFSDHSGIALLAGLLLALLLGKRLVLSETSYVFIISLFVFTLTLPFVFTFQELITYPAFWHKTAPIVYSFVLWFFLGLLGAQKLQSRFDKPILISTFMSLSLLAAVVFVETTHLREKVLSAGETLVAFRMNWDAGYPFGVGTILENVSESNILNFMQLAPYRHPFWLPPDEILKDVNLVFEPSSSQENGFAVGELKIRASSHYFSKELGERISVEFEVLDPSMDTLGTRSISSFTSRDSTVNLTAVNSSRGLLISGEIPMNKSVVLTFEGNCEEFLANLEGACYRVFGAKPGFSQEFSRIWSLDQ